MANELQHLAQRYSETPTAVNQDAVVRAAFPLVRSIIRHLKAPDHLLASPSDMESVGMLGLLQALSGYQPERGTPFVSYAYARIRGALIDYLRSIDVLPRERRRQLARIQRLSDELCQQLGDEPRDYELAQHIGIGLDEYHQLRYDAQRRFSLSLYAHTDKEGEQMVLDTIPNEEMAVAFQKIEQDSLHEYIAMVVKGLTDREQTILALYYFESLTLREIAQLLELTEARISQILSKILQTLRQHLQRNSNRAA